MTDAPTSDVSDPARASDSVDWDEEVEQAGVQKTRELFVSLGKAIRAHQLYDENNPVYQRFVSRLRDGLNELWEILDRLVVQVEENRLTWMGEEVYRSENRSDSLAFLFYKDGVREIAFDPGIEDEELVRLLDLLQRARNLQPESDDLVTVLWEEDLDHFDYYHVDVDMLTQPVEVPAPGEGADREGMQQVLEGEVGGIGEDAGDRATAGLATEEAAVGEDAGAGPGASTTPVDTEDFNPALYSLNPEELEQLRRELDEEMSRDLRRSVLAALFDRLEEPERPDRQSRILEILRTLLPNFLSRGVLRPAAAVLHELDSLRQAEGVLDAERRKEVDRILDTISGEEAVGEFVRAIQDGSIGSDARGLGTVLQFLRPRALEPFLSAAETEDDPKVKKVLRESVHELGERHPGRVVALMDGDAPLVVAGAARLAAAVGVEGAASRLRRLLQHDDPHVRLAAVDAAVSLRASSAASALVEALDDPDRNVRVAAARALGTLAYSPAASRFRELLTGKEMREADVSEMIAFFESYGELSDPEAVPLLDKLLNGKSFLGRREPEDIRAAAALALGRLETPEARQALNRAREQEEPVVRSAVNRALRGEDRDDDR